MRHADSLLVRTRIPKDQFGRYLRTGSWLRPDDHVEVKFNPWHDPKTGRFTFKGGGNGTWSGGGFTGGGGGSTGGGGASGNWGPPGKTQADLSRSQRGTITGKPGASAIRTVAASAVSSPTGTTVARNGYTYKIDDEGRTTQVTGTLRSTPTKHDLAPPRRPRAARTDCRPTMAVIMSLYASMARRTRSTISHRTPTSIAAAIACWRINGRRTSDRAIRYG